MNTNKQLIETFYTAFSNQNIETMSRCYHKDIQFQDPAFGILNGKDVTAMWRMLLERSKGGIKIEFYNTTANKNEGATLWIATYIFSKTNRKVVNTIHASFEFKEGLIYKHKDHFNMWNWSRQALGLKGLLLGWTPFFKKKIQEQAKLSLKIYQKKSSNFS